MMREAVQELLNDNKISNVLKKPATDFLSNEVVYDTKESTSQYIEANNEYILKDYSFLKGSLEYLRKEYEDIYQVNKMLYDDIYKIVSLYDILNGLWLKMSDDKNIPPVFSKLVAFWLSNYRYEVSERQRLAKEIVEEIRLGNVDENIDAIKSIKTEYIKLYKYKRTFFDGLLNEFEGIKATRTKLKETAIEQELDTKKAGGFLGLFKRKK